jgi:zinc transport system substrate-binding protein
VVAYLLGYPHDPDPHLWLSPLRLKGQLTLMAKSLTELFPKSASEIAKNLEETVKKLENLDLRIHKIIDHTPTTTVMVSHPAYLYFCTDYGLEQLSLERHGSEPGAQAVTDLIREARSKRLNRIFVQPQHSSKGAKVIAKTLDAEIIEMDPFSEDYFDNMRRIAWKFAGY